MQFELSLVDSGQIESDQFCLALARQQKERPPLGQIAIEEGILSPRDVRDILVTQRQSDHSRFGDVGKRLGILDRHQLAELLHIQVERQRPLLEHLVELGALTREQAADSRADYRDDRALMIVSRTREATPMA